MWLLWAASQIVFFGMLTGIEKKKDGKESCAISRTELVGQDAAQACGCQARPVHQALTLGQLWVWVGGRGALVVILSQRPC